MKKEKKIKLIPGPCLYCGKIIKIQKLWCNINCELQYYKNLTKVKR
jgi:hypothetical protein